MRKKITTRTPERLIRAAYDFEYLAGNMRREGYESEAETLQQIARTLGRMGREFVLK